MPRGLPYHQWVASFHTGFNLECLDAYERATGDTSFHGALERGLAYELEIFFRRPASRNTRTIRPTRSTFMRRRSW